MTLEPVGAVLLVTDVLERLGVSYLLGGSFASTVHGEMRTTMGADLVADLREEQVAPFVAALGPAFYVDAGMVRDAITRRSGFNVIHLDTAFKVDVFTSRGSAYDQEQLRRRVCYVLAHEPERSAYLATAEDTALAKLEWYRRGGGVSQRQWRDVLGVLRTQGSRLDVAYMRRWAPALDVTELLEQALAQAGLAEPDAGTGTRL